MLQKRENPDRARKASQAGTASGSHAPPLRVVTSWARSVTPSSSPSTEEIPPNDPGAIDNVEPNGIRTAYGGRAYRTGLRKQATTYATISGASTTPTTITGSTQR